MQVAEAIGVGGPARRNDDALAGKLDDRRALDLAAGWRKRGAIDRGLNRARSEVEHDAAVPRSAYRLAFGTARRRRQAPLRDDPHAQDLESGAGVGCAAAEQRFVVGLEALDRGEIGLLVEGAGGNDSVERVGLAA